MKKYWENYGENGKFSGHGSKMVKIVIKSVEMVVKWWFLHETNAGKTLVNYDAVVEMVIKSVDMVVKWRWKWWQNANHDEAMVILKPFNIV